MTLILEKPIKVLTQHSHGRIRVNHKTKTYVKIYIYTADIQKSVVFRIRQLSLQHENFLNKFAYQRRKITSVINTLRFLSKTLLGESWSRDILLFLFSFKFRIFETQTLNALKRK
jgi:hypothetical protein